MSESLKLPNESGFESPIFARTLKRCLSIVAENACKSRLGFWRIDALGSLRVRYSADGKNRAAESWQLQGAEVASFGKYLSFQLPLETIGVSAGREGNEFFFGDRLVVGATREALSTSLSRNKSQPFGVTANL